MRSAWIFAVLVAVLAVSSSASAKKDKAKAKKKAAPPDEGPPKDESWKKKPIESYTDADLEKLYEQWEEDEDELPLDELPEWDPRKPQPQIDFSKLDMSDTDNVMRATKKGKTVMMFVKVSGNPTKEEAEGISSIWQTGLWNTHISADRFSLEDDRVIFVFKDGDHAWEAREYFLEQERCYDVQLESKTYCGKHFPECEGELKEKEAKDKANNEKAVQERKKREEKEKKKKEKAEKKKKEKEASKGSIDEKDEL